MVWLLLVMNTASCLQAVSLVFAVTILLEVYSACLVNSCSRLEFHYGYRIINDEG